MIAKMAFPEIQQVHVVYGCLAALDLEDDAGCTHATVVVGAEPELDIGKEPLLLVLEAQLLGEFGEHHLDQSAARAGQIRGMNRGQGAWCIQMSQK